MILGVPGAPAPALALMIEHLAGAHDIAAAAHLVREQARRAIGCDGICLLLHERGELRPVAEDAGGALAAGCVLMRDTGIAALALARRRLVVVPDVAASDLVDAEVSAASLVRSLCVAPLGAGPPVGALVASWDRPGGPALAALQAFELLAAAVGRTLQAARLLETLPLLLFVRHPDGGCIPLGRQWAEYGIDPSGPAGRDSALHPDERDAIDRLWDGAHAASGACEMDHRLRHVDGAYRWFRTRVVPAHDGEGRLLHWIGACTDIDQLVEARDAEALRRLDIEGRLRHEIEDRGRTEVRLAKTERIEAIGQLTSGVAHDFNNLLTVIIGNIEFLEAAAPAGPLLDGRARGRLAAMREAAERGGNLTRQLLAFARRQRLEPRPTDLNDTVAELRGLLPSAIGGGLEVEAVLAPGLWPALVDRTEIERMILNLALNAHDAMAVGGAVGIGTRNRRLGPDEAEGLGLARAGDYVEISVTDTGRGMTPEVQARAFEPFFTTKPTGSGSGLGLAQVWGFAQQSGGIVTIRSAPGEGATVAILLPRAERAAEPLAPPATPGALLVATIPVRASGPEPLVLLVDDDVAVREVTSTIVAEAGYRVIEAASGQDALERLREAGTVDLMVTDYAMPGMNGHELACAAQVACPGLRVLFVTGYADLTALGGVGEGGILLKPFRSATLLARIAAALAA